MKTFREYLNENTSTSIEHIIKKYNVWNYGAWKLEIFESPKAAMSFRLCNRDDSKIDSKSLLLELEKSFPLLNFRYGEYRKPDKMTGSSWTEVWYEPKIDINDIKIKLNKILSNIDNMEIKKLKILDKELDNYLK